MDDSARLPPPALLPFKGRQPRCVGAQGEGGGEAADVSAEHRACAQAAPRRQAARDVCRPWLPHVKTSGESASVGRRHRKKHGLPKDWQPEDAEPAAAHRPQEGAAVEGAHRGKRRYGGSSSDEEHRHKR